MTKSAVSVIVPVYNTEEYVGKCLDSLLGQSLREIEVICVNDGSTDKSGEILRGYAGKDDRVRVLEQDNSGQAAARNRAVETAAGEYICFVDSDDTLETEALEKLMIRAKEERLDVLWFAGKTEYATEELKEKHDAYFDRAYRRDLVGREVMSGPAMLRQQQEVHQVWRTACMALIRRAFLTDREIRFREGIRYEDNLYAFLLWLRAERTASAPEQYYCRLLRENSTMTAGRTAGDLYGYVTTIADELALLQAEGPEDPAEREAFRAVIGDTAKVAYTVWKRLEEGERSELEKCYRTESLPVSEADLYHSLLESRFTERAEARREYEALEKKLRGEIKELRGKISDLRKEKQEILDSRSYRLGNKLLAPVKKIKGK